MPRTPDTLITPLQTTAAAAKIIREVAGHFDIIVATGSFSRGLENDASLSSGICSSSASRWC